MFKSKVYVKRRKELAEKLGGGVALFIGNDSSHTLVRDTVHKFRQNSNFLYYWGLSEPGLAALIDVDKNTEILFGHDLTMDEIVWEGEQPKMDRKGESVGVSKTADISTLKNVIINLKKGRHKIHYLPQHISQNILKLSDLLNKSNTQVESDFSIEFIKAVIAQRSIKSKKEVAEIEKALNTTLKLHKTAMQKAKVGKYEHQIVQDMEKVLINNDTRWAYLPICTVRGERLHSPYYNNKLHNGQLLINDSGAEAKYSFYSSDITRTFPVNGKFTRKQKEIYNIVLTAELQAIEAIKPGVKYLEIHMLAAKIIVDGLKKLGIMKGDSAKAIEAGAHALFFPHGLGHMLGLDVHDMEDLGEDYVGYNDKLKRSKQFGTAYLRFAKELKVGHVLTVEPGIYFIPQLVKQWKSANKFVEFINYDKVEKYFDFGGVRIEDNVLVTKVGHRVLGKPIPKTVKEIESIMNK